MLCLNNQRNAVAFQWFALAILLAIAGEALALAPRNPKPTTDSEKSAFSWGEVGGTLDALIEQVDTALAEQAKAGKELEVQINNEKDGLKGVKEADARLTRAGWATQRAEQQRIMTGLNALKAETKAQQAKYQAGQPTSVPNRTVVIRTIDDLLREEVEYSTKFRNLGIATRTYFIEFSEGSFEQLQEARKHHENVFLFASHDPAAGLNTQLCISPAAWIENQQIQTENDSDNWDCVNRRASTQPDIKCYLRVVPTFARRFTASLYPGMYREITIDRKPLDPIWKAKMLRSTGPSVGPNGGETVMAVSWTVNAAQLDMPVDVEKATKPASPDAASDLYWTARGYHEVDRTASARKIYSSVAAKYASTEYARLAADAIAWIDNGNRGGSRDTSRSKDGSVRGGGRPRR